MEASWFHPGEFLSFGGYLGLTHFARRFARKGDRLVALVVSIDAQHFAPHGDEAQFTDRCVQIREPTTLCPVGIVAMRRASSVPRDQPTPISTQLGQFV
jgi:hypothetical protein